MYTAVGKVEVVDLPEREPGPGEARVRVQAAGICGSDVHGFLGRSSRRQPGLVLGHEIVGRIDAVGAGVDPARRGERVAVNPLLTCGICPACRSGRRNVCPDWRLLGMDRTQGGFAEEVVVPEGNVYPLDEKVSDAAAVMIEPFANAFHLVSMIPKYAGLLPTATILGGGTLGSCILLVARARGVRILAVSEPNPQRAEVARRLGAPRTFDPKQVDPVAEARSLTDGLGPEVAIDAVGISATRTAAVEMLARGGTALLLGNEEGPTTLDFQDLVRREIRLQCSYAYTDADFAAAIEFVESGAVDLSPWTEVEPLERGQAAFDRLVRDPGDRLKVVLTP